MSYQEKYLKYKSKYLDLLNQFDQKGGQHLNIPQGTKNIDKMKYANKGLTSVTIPNSVISIGMNAFQKNALTSVEIPDLVTNIGNGAFERNKLTHVTIKNKVTSIGNSSFEANNLTSIEIPDSITSINNWTFNNNQLTSVTIPDSVTSIGEYSFSNNNLTNVIIENKITSIGEGAFSDNKLTSVIIPDSVTSIGTNAFSNNELTLTSVTIPDRFNTNMLKKYIFGDKYNSKNIIYNNNHLDILYGTTIIDNNKYASMELICITIPDSVISIGISAFSDNQLTYVTIPNSVTNIDKGAFVGNQLTSVTIGNKVTSIGDQAFFNNKLISVKIPESVISIDKNAFANNQLISLEIGNKVTSIGPGAFSNNKLTSVTIPDSVTIIDNDAFARNQLTSVTIGNKVTSIDKDAFSENQLISLEIGNNVSSIGNGAFSDNKLTNVTIPDSVTSIGELAFFRNEITSVTIGKKVTSIDVDAFLNNRLSSVTIPKSVTSIGDSAFSDNKLTNVVIPDSVTIINTYAFYRNELTSVTIPDLVTNISTRAFSYNKLTSVTIPDSVTSIGDFAFSDNKLTSVTMPARFNTNEHKARIFGDKYNIRNIIINQHLEISQGTTIISKSAFENNQLTSVEIPNSVTSIGDLAFSENQLTSIKIGNNVTSIGEHAFANNKLTNIKIGKKVSSISDGAFGFNKLTNVVIPDSVTTINSYAFYGNELTSITIGKNVENIGKAAFNGNLLLGSVTMPDKFNNDQDKERIFGSDFTKIIFTILSINSNISLFPTIAPVIDLVEELSIFDTIENELKNFGLNIQLGTIDDLRAQFKNLVDNPLNFATFKERIDATGSKNIELNRAYSDGTIERKIFTFKKDLSSGSFNTTDIYTSNNKEYIFRSSTSSTFEDQFKSFYENLKHIILYIIIRKRLGNIKFIPQPYHFGVKKDTITGQITLYMIMEKGKTTLNDYIEKTTLSADQLKKLTFSIYYDLYELNSLCIKDGDKSTSIKFKHNDFKCNNLVISENGAPLIIDFGFSQFTLTDAGKSIKFVSCEANRISSVYYKYGYEGLNVTHDMLQLLASYNFINIPGFNPFKIFKFVNNPGSNIFDTDVITSVISYFYGTQSVNSTRLFKNFYESFDLRRIRYPTYTLEITPADLAKNIGLTLTDRIIDTFEKKYRKYKMKYLKLVKYNNSLKKM